MNIAIIPARNGSKSIINKNLQKIGKKSLVQMAIKSAVESEIFDRIILTTDIPCLMDDMIPRVTIHKRDPRLCEDESLMINVVLSVIGECNINKNDTVFLLQPTSPFRVKTDYYSIISLLKKGKSVISVCDVKSIHPNRMYSISDNQLYPLRFTKFDNKQSLKPIYIRSGHYYVAQAKDLITNNGFYVKPCLPLIIEDERAINIDSMQDLETAKRIGLKW